jgi:WD40 repeat protein
LTFWDLDDNKKPKVILHPSKKALACLAFSPDGKTIAVGGLDRVVSLLDAVSGEVRLALRGPRKSITSLAFSPDGKTVASASDEPTLFVWDVAQGNVVSNPTARGSSVWHSPPTARPSMPEAIEASRPSP